jgi:N-acetylmuramoyl-L-alanine amidase
MNGIKLVLFRFSEFVFFVIILVFTSKGYSQTTDFTGYKVMINPGHGGHDSDDRGMSNGFWESESNLTKGLWLRDLLEARGCEIVMSRIENRTEDDLPLSQIAAMANENAVDLFLSIHSNAGSQVSNYPMTIFNGKSETPSIPEAKVWAQILADNLITNNATYWTKDTPTVIGDLTLNPTFTYGYGVLYPLEVPGIISEGSFHDYQPEVDRLLNIEYRKQEAWNMLYAMMDYFELEETESVGHISGLIRDSLLVDEFYTITDSPDKYSVVQGAKVELLETGDTYEVGDTVNAQWFFNGNNAPVDKEVDFNAGFYHFDSLPEGIYHAVFSGDDYFSDTIELEVKAHEFTYWNHWLKADKTMPPKLVTTNPLNGDTIMCFDPIQFTFNMNMDSTSFAKAFSISPDIDGYFEWDDDYLNVWFQPFIPYEKETEYTLFIDSTVEHQWGVNMDTTIYLSFITDDRNRFSMEKSFPINEQIDVSPYLQFRIIFDAPIKNTSLIDAVYIVDNEENIIGTKGAKITTIEGKGHYYFSAAEDLKYDEEYTLMLAGSIKDETNIPLVDNVAIKFTTQKGLGPQIVINDFEDLSAWSLDFMNSNEIDGNSFLYRWTSSKMEGSASLLVRYLFLAESGTCVINADQDLNLIQDADTIGLWIYGEMSENIISLEFDELIEKSLTLIDFAGWKYCSIAVPDSVSKVTGIKIEQTTQGALGGDLYFDMLTQPEVISDIVVRTDVALNVFPNPVQNREVTIAGLGGDENYFSIFETTGRLVQSGKIGLDNKIVLNSISGKYDILILKIKSTQVIKSILLFNK